MEAMRRGAMVKEVMPSMARSKRLRKFHEEVPAALSFLSNNISFFL